MRMPLKEFLSLAAGPVTKAPARIAHGLSAAGNTVQGNLRELGSAVNLKFLLSWPQTRLGTSNSKPHQNHNVASALLIPKSVLERAAMFYELRNRGH
jgi:hypothetical protein